MCGLHLYLRHALLGFLAGLERISPSARSDPGADASFLEGDFCHWPADVRSKDDARFYVTLPWRRVGWQCKRGSDDLTAPTAG
jgi:hypothetical protein